MRTQRSSSYVAALLFASSSAVHACADIYGDCFNSTCCKSGNFGCKRKLGKQFAQCRPMPDGQCNHEDGWECPGWELCSDRMQGCLNSKCCKDPAYGCFRRAHNQYAQCRPLPTPCTDSTEWLCPGWELCSDNFQTCANTHCCADQNFACYQKRPHVAQCMRRGTCVAGRDGDCVELTSEVGQCTAPYHDCHLTGCCQRGEDHCFLKNDFYGQCRPTCRRSEVGSDWSCRLHELRSERNKVTCDALRARTNLFGRFCSTQYEGESACNRAFRSQNNVYQPCVWQASTSSCMESSQVLACDCQLRGQNCPHPQTHVAKSGGDQQVHPGSAATATPQSDPSGEAGMSMGEVIVVTIAIIIIVGGCAGLAW